MKRLILISVAVILMLTVGATVALAAGDEQIPSAKAAYFTDDVKVVTYVDGTDRDWVDILNTQIKTGEPKDMVIDVSAECALVTDVKLGGTTGSEAKSKIVIRVLVDGVPALPGEVTFANRILRVEGDLTHHLGDTILEIDDHWFTIFQETSNANAFNFAIEDVGSGVHNIVVQAKLDTEEKAGSAYSNAEGWIGNASVVVDVVQFKGINLN